MNRSMFNVQKTKLLLVFIFFIFHSLTQLTNHFTCFIRISQRCTPPESPYCI